MKRFFISAAGVASLALGGCGESTNESENDPVAGSETLNSQSDTFSGNSKSDTPWQEQVDRDEFTDKVTISYSNGDIQGNLFLSCNESGNLGIWFHFFKSDADPMIAMGMNSLGKKAKIRLDDGEPFLEDWVTYIQDGEARPEDAQSFINKLLAADHLVLELFPDQDFSIRHTFELRGLEDAIEKIKSTGCRF